HAAQEGRSLAVPSESRLPRACVRARAACRSRRLVERRRQLCRGKPDGTFDRGTEGADAGVSELVRPLSLRAYRAGAAQGGQGSPACPERDRRRTLLNALRPPRTARRFRSGLRTTRKSSNDLNPSRELTPQREDHSMTAHLLIIY